MHQFSVLSLYSNLNTLILVYGGNTWQNIQNSNVHACTGNSEFYLDTEKTTQGWQNIQNEEEACMANQIDYSVEMAAATIVQTKRE